MHVVYVHDAKIVKENGLTLQFCSNYPSKMSRFDAMYIFLTNYNTIWGSFLPNGKNRATPTLIKTSSFSNKYSRLLTFAFLFCIFEKQ